MLFREVCVSLVVVILVAYYPSEEAAINEHTQSCSSREWSCVNGECISLEKRCDGEINCSDNSDEAPELCSAANSSSSQDACIWPPYPDHGTYNVTKMLKHRDTVSETLIYSCDEGYRLEGKSSSACVNGTWLAEAPTCTNQCKPLKSASVDFKCYKQNSTLQISCDLPLDNNSYVKATCKYSYYSEPPPKDLLCIKGRWDYMPYCTPECGTVVPEGETLIIKGEMAKMHEFPWHVGLYDKSLKHLLICGGSIFTPNLVVTAAHCVYKDLAGVHQASSFAVAAGKLYRHWSSTGDDKKYLQKIDVMKIEILESYKGSINAYTADIAVLILERSFILSSYVRPICIRFDLNYNLTGQFGRVAGWGLTEEIGKASQTLQTVRLPFVRFQDCFENSPEGFRPLLTNDKICAGYTNGTALCKGDSGGGLVFSRRNSFQHLYYLYGIVSTSPRNTERTSCSAFAYTAFTNIINYQEWLQQICLREWGCANGGCISFEQRCDGDINYCPDASDEGAEFCSSGKLSPSKNLCLLPHYPINGNYSATSGLKPGDLVPHTTLTYSCDEDYILMGEKSALCFKGIWAVEVPTCERQCTPLKSTSVDFKCYKQYSSVEISCDLPQDNNSRAKPVCKHFYHLEPSPKDLICIDGSWDYMPHCTTECGIVSPQGELLAINGENTNINEFPWHVGIYDTYSSSPELICGGSIFTPRLVITAANCVYREEFEVSEYPDLRYTVTAGKFYRSWYARGDDEKYVQKINVIKVEIPEQYKGAINSYAADIAVLILEESFELSSFVHPVCISFDYRNNFNGQLGKVPGWGQTEVDGRPSPSLQMVRLPIVSILDCYKNSPENFWPLITPDKICAGYTNGTALCKGDAGGGLVFSRRNSFQDLYYLYGITCVVARNKELTSCSAFSYTGFTDIMIHQEWLQQICLQEMGTDNGLCIPLEKRSHGEINCTDGSGDAAKLCSADNLSASKNMCILPSYPDNGMYSVASELKPGDAVSHIALEYTCDEGYTLKGKSSNFCVSGTWEAELPTCERDEKHE